MTANDWTGCALDDGRGVWEVRVPSRWTWVDPGLSTWIASILRAADMELERWRASENGSSAHSDLDLVVQWQVATQAAIVSSVRTIVDEIDDPTVFVGVDVFGPDGSTLVTAVGLSTVDRDLLIEATAETPSDLDEFVQRDMYLVGDLTVDRAIRAPETTSLVASALWSVRSPTTTSALQILQLSSGDGCSEALGVGNFIAQTAVVAATESETA